jgi:hypothetical protein
MADRSFLITEPTPARSPSQGRLDKAVQALYQRCMLAMLSFLFFHISPASSASSALHRLVLGFASFDSF